MKNLKVICFLVLIGIVSFTACSPSRNERVKSIKAYESMLLDNGNIEKQQADSLINMFETFADDFPKDSLAPTFLYKAAEVSMNRNKDIDKSISLFDKIIAEYPAFDKIADCYFMKGFVYDISGTNVEKARMAYEIFIEKYPDHYLVNDTKALINNLGIDPTDLVKQFEEANAEKETEKVATK